VGARTHLIKELKDLHAVDGQGTWASFCNHH